MKVAVVTGGTRGIGKEIARQLSERGYKVYAPGRIEMDVRNRGAIEDFIFNFNHDRLDLLVNNAGIFPEKSTVLECSTSTLKEVISTNAIGALNASQLFWFLIKKAEGRVINISSRHGLTNKKDESRACYSISKACLNHITILLSKLGEKDGVSVNALCPGHCRTDMGGEHAPYSVEESVDTAIWLATDAPKTLNGHFFINRQIVNW